MGKPTGFLDYKREMAKVLPPKERIQNFNEFRIPLNKEKQKLQGARCMAFGFPFCQASAEWLPAVRFTTWFRRPTILYTQETGNRHSFV